MSFTNLDRREREALKASIIDLGGYVCPDMSKSCTHLVVGNENKSSMKRQYVPLVACYKSIELPIGRCCSIVWSSCRAAHEWQIPVVSLAWLTETLDKRSVIPIASYRLQSSSELASTSLTAATDCTNATARQVLTAQFSCVLSSGQYQLLVHTTQSKYDTSCLLSSSSWEQHDRSTGGLRKFICIRRSSMCCTDPYASHESRVLLQDSMRSGANAASLSAKPAAGAVEPAGDQLTDAQEPGCRRRHVDMAGCPGSVGQEGMLWGRRNPYP